VEPAVALLDDDDLRDEYSGTGTPAGGQEASGGKVPGVLIIFLALALVISGLVVLGMYLLGRSGENETDLAPRIDRALVERNRFLREGWKAEAAGQLRGFLEAETVEDRARYVMGGETRLDEMRRFYAGGEIEGTDTPLAAFSHFDLQLADRQRGLFLMRYERPAQFNMREFFRPVAPLDVQYDVGEPGLLLSSFAMLENFAMDPVRVMAFFKREDGELKLDWDVFVQTKYRMLKSFSSYPQPGQRKVFRVILEEDLSVLREMDTEVERIYRLSDPANGDDHVKVSVPVDSELGQILSVMNWVGLVVDEKPSRTATVVLEWTKDREPELRMSEMMCWEFIGLGGEPGNTKPVTLTPSGPTGTVTLPVVASEPPSGTPARATPGDAGIRSPSPPADPGRTTEPVPSAAPGSQ
jgi:hypothetical protein